MRWLPIAYGEALVLGLRHGLDWDHLVALTDLTGSRRRPRESMALASMYAIGHALMILLLGGIAVVAALRLPDSVDPVMERLVGVSLLALGAWIAVTALRTRAVPPLRSRWMVGIDLGRRALRRVRRSDRPIVIEHDHVHDHGKAHDHEHLHPQLASDSEHLEPRAVSVATDHGHRHRHVLPPVADPFFTYGMWSSLGIGALHGIGAETPTQLLLFATAADASGTGARLVLLGCFIVGLLCANTAVALATTYGFRAVEQRRFFMAAVATLTAVLSIALGAALLLGAGDLPTIGGG
jgi:high-affinity nickel-transport protein